MLLLQTTKRSLRKSTYESMSNTVKSEIGEMSQPLSLPEKRMPAEIGDETPDSPLLNQSGESGVIAPGSGSETSQLPSAGKQIVAENDEDVVHPQAIGHQKEGEGGGQVRPKSRFDEILEELNKTPDSSFNLSTMSKQEIYDKVDLRPYCIHPPRGGSYCTGARKFI